jgi:hypothetical protein
LYRSLRLEVNRVEALVRAEYQRHKLQVVLAPTTTLAPPAPLSRQPTLDAKHGDRSTGLRKGTPGIDDRRDGQKTAAAVARLNWLMARERLLTDRLYSLQMYRERIELTAESLSTTSKHSSTTATTQVMSMNSLVDADMTFEAKTLAADVGFELRELIDQINDVQASINKIQGNISAVKAELTEAELRRMQQEDHAGLEARVRGLLSALQQQHCEQRAEAQAAHQDELKELKLRSELKITELNELVAGLRYRLRAKMQEVHRRDVVLRKLKRQLLVISRYHARNMNAQVCNNRGLSVMFNI